MSKFRLILVSLSVLLLCSCTFIGSKDEIGYFPVKLEKDGRWSMIGPDGKLLFQDEFEEVPTFVINGVFVAEEGETYSVYRASKNPELIIDNLKCAGTMSEGLIPIVKKDSRITLIDKDGKEKFVLGPYDGKEVVECDNRFSEGLLAVKTDNNKWGYINKDGEMVISPKYDFVNPFKEDYAIVDIYKNDSYNPLQYIINKKGETVLEINERYQIRYYHSKIVIKNGIICVYDSEKEKIGFLNIKGDFISVPSKVVSINDFNNEVFVFENKEGKCGVMSFDKDNTQLIRPKYNKISIISSNEFLVKYDDKYYLVNNEDEKIIDFSDYDYVEPSPISTTQNYIAQEGNVSVLLDKEGKQLGNMEFHEVCGDESYYYDGDDGYAWYVYSDYVNTQSITDVIEDCLTTYELGESMAKYVTNTEECDLNSCRYSVSNFDKKGSGNNIRLFLLSDVPYIKSHSKSYNTKAINANSKLKEINLELYTLGGCDVWNHSEKIDKHVANILESKGFKKEMNDEFVKDNIHVNMSLTHDSGYLIRIYKTTSNASFSDWDGDVSNQMLNEIAPKVYSNSFDGYTNVRAESNVKSEILCTLQNGPEGAELLSVNGKWSKVRVNGVVGYVWSANVQSKPTEPVYIKASDVVGTWVWVDETAHIYYYIFKSNGKFSYEGRCIQNSGTWSLSRNNIVLKYSDGRVSTYSFNGKDLNIEGADYWKE